MCFLGQQLLIAKPPTKKIDRREKLGKVKKIAIIINCNSPESSSPPPLINEAYDAPHPPRFLVHKNSEQGTNW